MTRTTDKPQSDIIPVVPTPATPPSSNGRPTKSLNDPIIPNHPLAPLAGKYANEPLWDEYMEAIREYRRRVDEQEDEIGDLTTLRNFALR